MSMANHRFALYRSYATINPPASSACNRSAENCADARAPSCFKVQIVENGKIKATWFVVPGSGTGDLSGLRGEGDFEGQFGKRFRRNAGILVRMM
jgi:hypothetical protein